VSWNTANNAVFAEWRRVLIGDTTRIYGVKVIYAVGHVGWHTRLGDKIVTVIVDVTPIRDKTGSSRL
jgi:hypothetical protein